jgi:hypothetical protein
MKLKVGDVFTIPISDDKTGFGQIIKIPNKSNFIIIVFKQAYPDKDWPSTDEIIKDEILFLGYTMDALFYHKYWHIIGNNTSNLNKISLPYFKLGTPPDMKIVNFKGDKVRKANKSEFDNLEYETVVAPVGYEAALQAYHKLAEWEEYFDKILYDKTLESIKVVEGK